MKFLVKVWFSSNFLVLAAGPAIYYTYMKRDPASLNMWMGDVKKEAITAMTWALRFSAEGDRGRICQESHNMRYGCFFLATKKQNFLAELSWVGTAALWAAGVQLIYSSPVHSYPLRDNFRLLPVARMDQIIHWGHFVVDDLELSKKLPDPVDVLVKTAKLAVNGIDNGHEKNTNIERIPAEH